MAVADDVDRRVEVDIALLPASFEATTAQYCCPMLASQPVAAVIFADDNEPEGNDLTSIDHGATAV